MLVVSDPESSPPRTDGIRCADGKRMFRTKWIPCPNRSSLPRPTATPRLPPCWSSSLHRHPGTATAPGIPPRYRGGQPWGSPRPASALRVVAHVCGYPAPRLPTRTDQLFAAVTTRVPRGSGFCSPAVLRNIVTDRLPLGRRLRGCWRCRFWRFEPIEVMEATPCLCFRWRCDLAAVPGATTRLVALTAGSS